MPDFTIQMATALIATTKLDVDKIHKDDIGGWYRSKAWVGLLLFGQFGGPYSLSHSLLQVKHAAVNVMAAWAYTYGKEALASLPADSFEKFVGQERMLFPVACYTICYVELPMLKRYISNECVDLRAR
jgi:hypothetical protein